MKKYIQPFVANKNLGHLKIWISGAIPEREKWPHPLLDQDIIEFLAFFSALVLAKGGTIIHGSHPLFTPVIAEQARRFAKENRQLRLYVSNMWGTADLQRYKDCSVVIPVRSYLDSTDDSNAEHRNRSLTLLREKMASDSTSILALGGRFHSGSGIKPGVTEELQIADRLAIPSFVLAGFGGEAATSGEAYFKNVFLSNDEKSHILNSKEIAFLPSTLIGLLERDRHKIALHHLVRKLTRKLHIS